MAITFLEKRKKQKYLVFSFIILLLAILSVIWLGLIRKPIISPPPIIYTPPKIEINFEALRHPFLKESQIFEEIKSFEDTKFPEEKLGRENPFLPY